MQPKQLCCPPPTFCTYAGCKWDLRRLPEKIGNKRPFHQKVICLMTSIVRNGCTTCAGWVRPTFPTTQQTPVCHEGWGSEFLKRQKTASRKTQRMLCHKAVNGSSISRQSHITSKSEHPNKHTTCWALFLRMIKQGKFINNLKWTTR